MGETVVQGSGRSVPAGALGGMAEVASTYGVNRSTMSTIAARARAAGIAPEPVVVLERGAVYVVADWAGVMSGRAARRDRRDG